MAAIIEASLRDPSTWDTAEATETALRRGGAYAALSTTRPGAMPSYGDSSELAEFLSADGREVHRGEGEPTELARRLLEAASPALRARFAP